MGQISDALSNQIKGNNESFRDLICSKCNSHLLLELIQSKERIMLRSYCFCGSLTTYLNEDIKFLLTRYDFYQGYSCHVIPHFFEDGKYEDPKIKKYCIECHSFLCNECLEKHKHNKIINAQNYIFNCVYHRDSKIIGFCKTCKKSFCNKCIENKYHHKKHDIIYNNKLKDINDIIKTFELNLKLAFDAINYLTKMKYGHKYSIKITNLFYP